MLVAYLVRLNFFRSEMHTEERQRFGLILEAYCRGCGSYLKSLIKQVDALDKLTKLTDQVKSEKEVTLTTVKCEILTNPLTQTDFCL